MVNQVYQMLLERYESMGKTLRLALKPLARHVLMELEKKHGTQVRPPKGDDPSLHLVKLLLGVLIKGMPNVSVIVSTTPGTTEIQSFDLSVKGEGESGGQVVTHGNIGEWQDDGGEDVRRESRKAVSNITPLYPRLQNGW